MDILSYMIIAAVAAACVLALRYSLKHKGCSGGCGGCAYRDSCSKSKKR